MPAVQRSEFTLALNQVAAERGIDPDVVLDTVRQAILAAYRKDHPGIEVLEYEITLNPDNGEAHVLHQGADVTPPGFGRIAAQTAKQVILQKIREAEKSAILSDFSERLGGIVNSMVLRFDGPNIIVDIGKAEGVMPPVEQIPGEHYRLNQRLTVYLSEIKEGLRGSEIIVSRAHKGLISALLRREVPEVAQGAVVVKEIARESGSRSKVAVFSTQSGVDPVGSCVGQKGVRVQAVINELGGLEKIDVIQWSDDVARLIAQALSPAKDLSVTLNEEAKEAKVTAPDDQLSLAIGRDGQNVRLASKLTGYKIEIRGKSEGVHERSIGTRLPRTVRAPAAAELDRGNEVKEAKKVVAARRQAKVAMADVTTPQARKKTKAKKKADKKTATAKNSRTQKESETLRERKSETRSTKSETNSNEQKS